MIMPPCPACDQRKPECRKDCPCLKAYTWDKENIEKKKGESKD